MAGRDDASAVACVRVEQLYPFPDAGLRDVLGPYGDAEVVWVQEEPRNMGAWPWIQSRLRSLLGREPAYIGRPERASPAEGFAVDHEREQNRITTEALSASPRTSRGRARSKRGSTG
jgi:2-oxoglutarate dehydrogenase E1 component